MKKTVLVLVITAIAAASSALAEVNVNVSIGVPAQRIVVNSPPTVHFEVAPLFIASPRLGFYVGVDTPYDIVFSSGFFYLYYNNSWHRSQHHNGPWVEVPYRNLPPGISRHRIEQIRSYRDREYRAYRKDRKHYRGRYFRPDHEEQRYMKEERRHDKERRKEEKRDRKQHGHGRD